MPSPERNAPRIDPGAPQAAPRDPTTTAMTRESLEQLIAENDEVRILVEEKASALYETNRGNAACYDCGLAYAEDGWIECVVSNNVWKRISPSGDLNGLLCITCIARRVKRLGLADVPVMLVGTEAIKPADQEAAFARAWGQADITIRELREQCQALSKKNARQKAELRKWITRKIETEDESTRLAEIEKRTDHLSNVTHEDMAWLIAQCRALSRERETLAKQLADETDRADFFDEEIQTALKILFTVDNKPATHGFSARVAEIVALVAALSEENSKLRAYLLEATGILREYSFSFSNRVAHFVALVGDEPYKDLPTLDEMRALFADDAARSASPRSAEDET